jgi:hypothetical protein
MVGIETCSAAGKCDAGADFADRLVDQGQGAFAMAALVRRRCMQFAAGRLQQGNALVHVRLGADGVADAMLEAIAAPSNVPRRQEEVVMLLSPGLIHL